MEIDENVKNTIQGIIEDFEKSVNTVDTSMQKKHIFLDDSRFSEIEDFIPEPIGAKAVTEILEWLEENGKPGNNMKFQNISYYQLSKNTVYTTAIQHLNIDNEPSKSRVTFIFINTDNKWGLIHAHYSAMPKEDH